MVKVSVIIPTLNEEKYVEFLLFHLRKQKPYEIIVADSQSEDTTRQIAKRYGARVVNAPRKNAAAGRNAGGRAARGDVLLFLDADNVPFTNLVEVVKKNFEKDKKLVGWTCNVFAFSPAWREQMLFEMFNDLIRLLIKMNKPHAAGIVMAMRKSAFNAVGGFDEGRKVVEDHDMALRIGKLGKFAFSKDTCVFTSTRRIKKWGIGGILKAYSRMYVNFLTKGKKEFDYEPVR